MQSHRTLLDDSGLTAQPGSSVIEDMRILRWLVVTVWVFGEVIA